MRAFVILTVAVTLLTGCDQSRQQAQNRVELDRKQYLVIQEAGRKSILTQRRAFLGFILYSKLEDVRNHLDSLTRQNKVSIPSNTYSKADCDFSYIFNIPNLDGVSTPIKFSWDEDRLKSISGEIRAYANDWINPEIVKIFESKLGPSKSFYETDASKCYYWIKGGQEVILIFPLKANPKFIYTALTPTQESVDEKNRAERERVINDSVAASSTSKDL